MTEVITLNENKIEVNTNGNKNSNVNVSVNVYQDEKDLLNPGKIYESSDVFEMAKEIDNRINFSCTVYNDKILPPALKKDFDIRYKRTGKTGHYYLYPTTEDAYQKFPLSTRFTMKFPTAAAKKDFQENGFAKLQAIANETQKPVPIPYIVAAKEFIGSFENPVSYINRYGWGDGKIFILPEEIPPAQNYIIKLLNSEEDLTIETKLRITPTSTAEIILTNKESSDEPFDIIIKMLPLKKGLDTNKLVFNFSITVKLRKDVENDYECNIKMRKFVWLINDKKGTFIFKFADKQGIISKKQWCGKAKYTASEYKRHKEEIKLMEDVLRIIELSGIDIKLEPSRDYISKNEIKIAKKLLYSQKCCFGNKTYWKLIGISDDLIEKISNQTLKNIPTTIEKVSIGGVNIPLPKNTTTLKGMEISEIIENDGVKIAKVAAKSVTITPVSEI